MLAFSRWASGLPTLGHCVSWWPGEQAEGCVLQGSRALPKTPHWPGPGLEAVGDLSPDPRLCDLLAVTDLVHLWLRPSLVGCLAPSVVTAGQGLGTWHTDL